MFTTPGHTFDTVWNAGVYETPTPDGGSYTVIIREAATVPEPTSLAVLGIAAGVAAISQVRRRRCQKQ